MPYRLPPELVLTILELAAPPLAIDSLHDRVAFFINVSLVHRSFTAWAQERLHDQFLYTYQPRPDEHERLKTRFEAGFGRDRSLRRLYLDLTQLPEEPRNLEEPRTLSVSFAVHRQYFGSMFVIEGPGGPEEAGAGANEQASEAVAVFHVAESEIRGTLESYWALCPMMAAYSQLLDTLWLKPPIMELDIADWPSPRVLYMDDGAFYGQWGHFPSLPVSSKTVVFLRNVGIGTREDPDVLEPRQLVIDNCYMESELIGNTLYQFRRLETLVLSETRDENLGSIIYSLPSSTRRVHILQHDVQLNNFDVDHFGLRNILPQLESFTFTLFQPSAISESQASAGDDLASNTLAKLQQVIESMVDAPQCTFKCLYTTKSPKEALADALMELGLES